MKHARTNTKNMEVAVVFPSYVMGLLLVLGLGQVSYIRVRDILALELEAKSVIQYTV